MYVLLHDALLSSKFTRRLGARATSTNCYAVVRCLAVELRLLTFPTVVEGSWEILQVVGGVLFYFHKSRTGY